MLLNDVYIYHNNGAEAYIMREPERLDHDALLCKTVHEGDYILRSTDAFLQDTRHCWMRYWRSAAEVREIIQEE